MSDDYIKSLEARVRELERLEKTNDEVVEWGNKLANKVNDLTAQLAALTQAHQQLVKDRDMQASTIRSMRVTIDGLNVLVDSLSSGNEQRDAQLQQAVEALKQLAAAVNEEQLLVIGSEEWCVVASKMYDLATLATHKEKG